MNLAIELEQETDGRSIAEIDELSGVLVYGETREEGDSESQDIGFARDRRPFGKRRKFAATS